MFLGPGLGGLYKCLVIHVYQFTYMLCPWLSFFSLFRWPIWGFIIWPINAAESESLLESFSLAGAGHFAVVVVPDVWGELLSEFCTVHAGQLVEAAVDDDLDELLE